MTKDLLEAAKKGAAKWKAKQQTAKKVNKKAAGALQKHIQTKNVKRLMTTGGAYKKRAPIKVVGKKTSAHPGGGYHGYKFYKGGGRAGFQHGGRTDLLEELGRVEAEPSNRNRRAEISRVHRELNRGYKSGGAVLKGKKVGIQIK